METFIGGVGLLVISGSAWAAYNHPAFYRVHVLPLLLVCSITTLVTAIATTTTVREIVGLITGRLVPDAEGIIIPGLREMQSEWELTAFVALGLALYSVFLLLIPQSRAR